MAVSSVNLREQKCIDGCGETPLDLGADAIHVPRGRD